VAHLPQQSCSLRIKPLYLAADRFCTFPMASGCGGATHMDYGHDYDHLTLPQAAQMPMYKTKLCQKFMQTGACNRGDECSFAHGYTELRQAPPGGPLGRDMPGMGPGPGPGPMGMTPVRFWQLASCSCPLLPYTV